MQSLENTHPEEVEKDFLRISYIASNVKLRLRIIDRILAKNTPTATTGERAYHRDHSIISVK